MRLGIVVTTLLALSLTATSALADHKKHSDTPWADGVSDERKASANKKFDEGNELMLQKDYKAASFKFEAALKDWDNPAIHLNLGICYSNMRKTKEAWDELTAAMKYGEKGLGKDLFAQATTLKGGLDNALATLVIKTTQDDVVVQVDGNNVLHGAGEVDMRVLVGKHTIVTAKDGFETDTRAPELAAGKTVTQEITLDPVKEHVRVEVQRENYERRFPYWVPWAVLGGAAVLAIAGTGTYLEGKSEMNRYDSQLGKLCPQGCASSTIPAGLHAEYKDAKVTGDVAGVLFVGAGVVAVAGAVLAVMNRPEKLEEHKVIPEVNATRASVTAGITFVFQ